MATPTLVIRGRQDAIIPVSACQRDVRPIPGATADLDRRGHMPEMEQPEAFVQAVLELLGPRT